MNPIEYSVLIHFGVPLVSAGIAGIGCYFGVRYAIKDHAIRLDLLVQRQMWTIRKLIALGTQHNTHHPADQINMNDFPEDKGGAWRV